MVTLSYGVLFTLVLLPFWLSWLPPWPPPDSDEDHARKLFADISYEIVLPLSDVEAPAADVIAAGDVLVDDDIEF